MAEIAHGLISVEAGLAGDYKGAKFPLRQITVLARETWEAAAAEIDAPGLPWSIRRANLLVEGVELPRAKGGILNIGSVRLEVTCQTYPCIRMEEAWAGLLKALARDWRGGGHLPGLGRRANRVRRRGGGAGAAARGRPEAARLVRGPQI